jgi:hypothetical protein
VDDEGQYAVIYYDDTQVYTVYAQDAAGFGSAGAYASACTDMLRQWATQVNAAGTVGKTNISPVSKNKVTEKFTSKNAVKTVAKAKKAA